MNAAPKERPILMSAPMVQSCLREVDPKTQTRRAIKPQPHHGPVGEMVNLGDADWAMDDGDLSGQWRCPYGVPGDRLWVRESWCEADTNNGFAYMADYAGDPRGLGWRPSIHMPRRACRLTLEITDVRVERLNKISEADAVAEGLIWRPAIEAWAASADPNWPTFTDPVRAYRGLWEHINGPGSWAANPWVWVVVFKRAKDTPPA